MSDGEHRRAFDTAHPSDFHSWRAQLAQLTAAGIEPRYPWHEWFDGQTHQLIRGLDYHVSTVRLQSNASTAARRLGVRLRTARTEAGCTLVAVIGEGGADG